MVPLIILIINCVTKSSLFWIAATEMEWALKVEEIKPHHNL